jgi:hypothetical protein
MRWAALLLVLTVGCATPINDLKGLVKPIHYKQKYNRSIEAIKTHYFTNNAYRMIEDIPCVDGFTTNGASYVVGVNFWSTMAGILTGSGYSRKCVITQDSLHFYGVESVVHEYVHQIDDIGRDNEHLLISLEEFAWAYKKMAKDRQWAGLVFYTEARANSLFTDIFGVGELSEHIAYVAGRMASQRGGPDYMWWVFRKVLKNNALER